MLNEGARWQPMTPARDSMAIGIFQSGCNFCFRGGISWTCLLHRDSQRIAGAECEIGYLGKDLGAREYICGTGLRQGTLRCYHVEQIAKAEVVRFQSCAIRLVC